jgi:hypothetical protein
VAFKNGLFGPIEIRDTAVSRQILLNGQVQGGSYFNPSAGVFDDELPHDAPGPVAESAYALGWLIAGVLNPTGSGLMIGLGSGAGVVQLLANFPGVDLTVVEIDPVMAQAALTSYPLLDWYMNNGQLNIVIGDAADYLKARYDVWDFACLDAYTGEQDLKFDHLALAAERADDLYLNVIDTLDGPILDAVLTQLREEGKPAKDVFKIPPYGHEIPYTKRSNWMVTTQHLDWQALGLFEPFPGLDYRTVRTVQEAWDLMLAMPVSAII